MILGWEDQYKEKFIAVVPAVESSTLILSQAIILCGALAGICVSEALLQ